MVNVIWTINGLQGYKLITTWEGTYTYCYRQVSGIIIIYWGIRVWKRTSGGVETEITAGEPVAVVSRDVGGEGIQSNTWSCPETALNTTDSIVVRVYDRAGSANPWFLEATFTTEQLGASKLDAAVWTVYYYTKVVYDDKSNYTNMYYYFGDATYYSRITNFTWTPGAPPPPAGYSYSDGLVSIQVGG